MKQNNYMLGAHFTFNFFNYYISTANEDLIEWQSNIYFDILIYQFDSDEPSCSSLPFANLTHLTVLWFILISKLSQLLNNTKQTSQTENTIMQQMLQAGDFPPDKKNLSIMSILLACISWIPWNRTAQFFFTPGPHPPAL